jgi:UDP-N-acetylmuramoyl-tripeptide--D-alanyl-D-alanine ligase
MHIEDLYEVYLLHPSVQTDTRKLKEGDIFFALKGENFNGNSFAASAIASGASYAIIDNAEYEIPGRTILVNDVLQSLQQLARYHRDQFNIPFLAITGSNGKTTTKELIHAVLSTSLRTYTTEGNLNNHIGVPLTILAIKVDAQIAVIEMGANHQQEIATYCRIANPTHGLITNIGKAHLEGFGGEEGVRKGKGELFDHLRENGGTAFVMWDDPNLRDMSSGMNEIVTYGTQDAEITGSVLKSEPFLEAIVAGTYTNGHIQTQLAGGYNLPNVLAAVAVAEYFGVSSENIIKAIDHYTPSNNRSQLLQVGTNTIIMDAYNANPSSMRLAIENIAAMEGEKVLILGAMAELGPASLAEHQSIVDLINQHQWKAVALTGGDFLALRHPYLSFPNSDETAKWFSAQQFNNTKILIKGSRSSKMEQVLNGSGMRVN